MAVPQPEVTYEPEMEYENSNSTPRESYSAKRKRLRLELKEKKRAFKSFPHTPTLQEVGGSNELGPYRGRRNATEPASPIENDLNIDLSVFSVTR